MQETLRHDVVQALFNAQPVDMMQLDEPIETDLTRAARQSVDNADRILTAEEFAETDFVPKKANQQIKKQETSTRKKSRKAERQRKKAGKRRK